MPTKDIRQAEFEQMLHRTRRILFRVCLTFTDRQADNVNDLYQEIVRNLWCGWPNFRGESDPTTWVYRVALNTAGGILRKRKKNEQYKIIPIDEMMLKTLAEESDPMREELYELINQLADDERKLIFLYLDHLSYAEIAEIENTTENAVKQHIYRIKKKLIRLHKQEK